MRSAGFWYGWGFFMLGGATEKWFVASGWADNGIAVAVTYTALGLAALTYAGFVFVKTEASQ